MDDFEITVAVSLLVGFTFFLIGLAVGSPQKLENDCLVDSGKIYCEKVEVNE